VSFLLQDHKPDDEHYKHTDEDYLKDDKYTKDKDYKAKDHHKDEEEEEDDDDKHSGKGHKEDKYYKSDEYKYSSGKRGGKHRKGRKSDSYKPKRSYYREEVRMSPAPCQHLGSAQPMALRCKPGPCSLAGHKHNYNALL